MVYVDNIFSSANIGTINFLSNVANNFGGNRIVDLLHVTVLKPIDIGDCYRTARKVYSGPIGERRKLGPSCHRTVFLTLLQCFIDERLELNGSTGVTL